MKIDHHFPGSNVLVEKQEGNTFFLKPDWSSSSQWWFYVQFQVRGVAGQTARFVFVDGDVFGAEGPAVSSDGKNWRWLGRKNLLCEEKQASFELRFDQGQDTLFIASVIPYTSRELETFLQSRPQLERSTIGRSEGGREIPLLRRASQNGQWLMIATARLHACEAMGSSALEGWIDAWDEDSPEGEWLRTHADLAAMPLFDIDGVEAGDQGKLRLPHDHNRDFQEMRYAATRGLVEALPGWRGRHVLGLDFHCPWIREGRNEELFLVGVPEPWSERQNAYAEILEKNQKGPLQYRASNNLAFGKEWNTVLGPTAAGYFCREPRSVFACTVEVPYARAGGAVVLPEGARSFGRDLGRAAALFASGLKNPSS